MNHAIRSLSFGDPMTGVKLPANFEPLQGKDTKGKDPMASHDYTLKIVPTVYTDINRRTRFGYQYTAVYKGQFLYYKHSRRKSAGNIPLIILLDFVAYGHGQRVMPAIWFRYEVSPITVKYTHKKKPIYHFLTTFCAIIGGTFTVAGMIDSMIFSAHNMVKKASEGKLS